MKLQREQAAHLLLLDTGDALIGGGVLGDLTRGQAVVDGMNLMGYDAMALGPKELSLGPQVLSDRMKEATFPVLSANVVLQDRDDLVAEPFVLLDVGDHTVGVVGITRVSKEQPTGYRVLNPKAALVDYVPQVAEVADTVVVLTNLTYRRALALAQEVPGIDLVVAALPGQLPKDVAIVPETGTLVVTAEQPVARHTGRYVGLTRVTVQSDGSLADASWQTLPMDPTIADDPAMQSLLEAYTP